MVDPGELRDVFDRTVSLPPADRPAFLEQACGGNAALRREIERLLDANARGGSAFDTAHTGVAVDSPNPADDANRMSLPPGTRLGPYQITAALGAGGMGEVYKARDTRLARTVAIKVLSSGQTQDPTARQRFDREARAVAGLSHPHICPLFDVGHQDGTDFLVMEYLAGETLATRLARGTLPLDQALTYASEIAQALTAAHRAGIVHRDLKPGNVMVTADGIKLLDFGLAKHSTRPVVTDTTVARSDPLTGSGVILGTVQYMAPEQLEGREADERTDIFAFGVVLYEMVTGRRAFEGPSTVALIGNILHADPPLPSSIVALTPLALDDIVRRCLTKAPAARCQSMIEVHTLLRRVQLDSTAGSVHARLRVGIALMVAVLLVVLAALVWRLSRASSTALQSGGAGPTERHLTRLTFDSGLQTDPVFSPDGRFIAYASNKAGNFDIWVQLVSGGDPVQITKSGAQDTQPSWSPDGGTIAFRSERDGGGLYLVSALGGSERLLAHFGVHPSWSSDGAHLYFLRSAFDDSSAQLYTVSIDGESPRQILAEFTANGAWRWIAPHPDGRFSFLGTHKALGFGLFTVSSEGQVTTSEQRAVRLIDLTRSASQRFIWNRSGTVLFLETTYNGIQNVWRIRAKPMTLELVSAERLTTSAGSDVSVAPSPDGTRVVFSSQRASERLWQFGLDASGKRLLSGQPVTEESALVGGSDVSPDGRVAVYNLLRQGTDGVDLWLTHLGSGRSERFAENAQGGVWSPDGQRIAYTRTRSEPSGSGAATVATAIAVRPLGKDERLAGPWSTDTFRYVTDWAADGREVLASEISGGSTRLVLWPATEPATEPARIVLAERGANMWQGKFSPNRRWLSFVVTRSNGTQIGVATADGPPDRRWSSISTKHDWADKPRWSSAGDRIYFLTNQPSQFLNLAAVDFDPEQGQQITEPYVLSHFEGMDFRISPHVQRTEMHVVGRQVFLTMLTASGNVWMLDNVDR